MGTVANVLYYGIFAAFTGGWLPLRSKRPNRLLVISHLYAFLIFVAAPLTVFLIEAEELWGWLVYTILIGIFFAFVKSINYRLHKLFGTDPLILKEKETSKEEEIKDDKMQTEDKEKETDEEEQDTSTVPEYGFVPYPTKVDEPRLDIDVEVHKSASSLNSTTDRTTMETSAGTLEMAQRSPGSRRMSRRSSPKLDTRDVNATTSACNMIAEREGKVQSEGDIVVKDGAEQGDLVPLSLPTPSGGAPSHSAEDFVSCASVEPNIQKLSHSSLNDVIAITEGDTEIAGSLHSASSSSLQRSSSMPTRQRSIGMRNNTRNRICVQQRQQWNSSTSSQRHQSSTGAAGNTEQSVLRDSEKSGDETLSSASLATGDIKTQPAPLAPPTSPTHHPTSSYMRQLSDAYTLTSLIDQHSTDGTRFSLELVEKLPQGLLEAIKTDALSTDTYARILTRQKDLRQGHLPSASFDYCNNDLIWWEDSSGNWDFDLVASGTLTGSATSTDHERGISLHQDVDPMFDFDSPLYPSPPVPSLRQRGSFVHSRSIVQSTAEPAPKMIFSVLPYWNKWKLDITFNRTLLEEFMDRNISMLESLSGVMLAVLVCVVVGLLLNIGFYKNFWVFNLSWVVGTAHFSLIKNASPDPASPSPGQNRMTAFSRGFYFILVGMIAFVINVALDYGPQDPLTVYRINLSSPQILLFVRDGLLIFILFFPVIFTIGLLPQVDTFIVYIGEQIDINIFGGTAATGVTPAIYSVLHSVVYTGLLYIIGYGALEGFETPTSCSVGVGPDEESCSVQVVYAIYMGLLFAFSYHMSRMSSDPEYVFEVIKKGVYCLGRKWGVISTLKSSSPKVDEEDPLDALYKKTVLRRLLSDFLVMPVIFLVVFLVSISTVFCHTHDSEAGRFTIYGITCVLGVFNHYIVPHIRKEMPWLCFGAPLYNIALGREEEPSTTKVTRFEKLYQWSVFIERNVMYPLSFLIAFHHATPYLLCKFGEHGAALVLSVIGVRLLRGSYTELSRQHIIFIFTLFFFNFDYEHLSESLPLDYFIISLLFYKFYDLLLKIRFIVIYISPWLFSWGSVAHLVLQPLLIPHSPFIFFMTLMASLFNAPVNPVVASTLFIISYVRPVKFWEKNYKTNRLDNSQTRLQAQLDQSLRQPSHEHLDSLFYEHLTWALQKTLAGDLQLGRWGRVTAGDIFILSGDRLNALIHIIEYGNGFVTFQIRGLEFRGTYCHQREVEAITESESDDRECCCCEPGHLPGLLSFNAAIRQRWLAWEVVSRNYTVPGYSISENQADYVFNAHEYRKNYINFFVQAMIYMFIKSPSLNDRLANESIQQSLKELEQDGFSETSDIFSETLDSDYLAGSITRGSFIDTYYSFIDVCASRILGRDQSIPRDQRSYLVTMCFACSLLGRRLFYQVMNTRSSHWNSVYCDYFLHGLYTMFVGDARPSHTSDEWVYHDLDILKEVVLPSVRIALKLHQDYFTYSEQYRTTTGVYSLIEDTHLNHVVAHEGDRAWRNAIILNRPSLLAMRYQRTNNDGTEVLNYPYTLVRLASRYIKFKVVKINRECVRSLWASQQHELIFLQNDDSERGSIQNAKPVLRNMVNSSMDLPIGYPVYVSPLTTSYIDEHEPINRTALGKYVEPMKLLKLAKTAGESCVQCTKSSLGSSAPLEKSTQSSEGGNTVSGLTTSVRRSSSVDSLTGMRHSGMAAGTKDSDSIGSEDDSVSEFMAQIMKPKWINKSVIIIETSMIQDSINERWLKWPESHWQKNGNRIAWHGWYPTEGMAGTVVHEWKPSHPKIEFRSHLGKIIVLLEIKGHFVPIIEDGVIEVDSANPYFS